MVPRVLSYGVVCIPREVDCHGWRPSPLPTFSMGPPWRQSWSSARRDRTARPASPSLVCERFSDGEGRGWVRRDAADGRAPWCSRRRPHARLLRSSQPLLPPWNPPACSLREQGWSKRLHAQRRCHVVSHRIVTDPTAPMEGLHPEGAGPAPALIGDGPMNELMPDVAPQPSELVLVKQYASAFFGTTLASTLRANGIGTVVIVGVSTSGLRPRHRSRCAATRVCAG